MKAFPGSHIDQHPTPAEGIKRAAGPEEQIEQRIDDMFAETDDVQEHTSSNEYGQASQNYSGRS
jgi:hypothetical protein